MTESGTLSPFHALTPLVMPHRKGIHPFTKSTVTKAHNSQKITFGSLGTGNYNLIWHNCKNGL